MVSIPSLLARLIEFITAVFGSFWGLWGTVTALLTLIGAVAWAFALDQAQTAMQQWLRSTQVRRLVVFAAISIFFFAAANFQAFDELNRKHKEALTHIAVAESSQQQSRSPNEKRSQM